MFLSRLIHGADGVIGIGITATAVGLIAGGIAAALARKSWSSSMLSWETKTNTQQIYCHAIA